MIKKWIFIGNLFLAAIPCVATSTQADLDLLRERMLVNESAKARASSANLTSWLSSQKADGSWADIDYTSLSSSLQKANVHVTRLESFAQELLHGVTTIGTYNLATQIGKGLDYYTKFTYTPQSGYSCGDRYAVSASARLKDQTKCQAGSTVFNASGGNVNNGNFTIQFNESMSFGHILLVLKHGAYFPDANLIGWSSWIDSRMQQGFVATGTSIYPFYGDWNLSQEANGLVSQGIIQGNGRLVDSTFRQLGLQMSTSGTTTSGLQSDGSYNEHTQLYDGGYPAWFLNDLHNMWINWGGNFSMGWSATIKQNLVDMVLDGFIPMTQYDIWDPTVTGRVISDPDITRQAYQVTEVLADVVANPATYGTYRLSEVKAAQTLMQATPAAWPWAERAAKLFWDNDYATLHEGHWMLSYRYASSRIHAGEQFNGENLKGVYLHFGVYWLHHQRPFDQSLFPVMDWAALPGLTMDRLSAVPQFPAQYPLGSGNFAGGAVSGGASDQNTGSTAAIGYDYNVSSITGSKAAFFLDGYSVFLGAGLSFTKAQTVATTVNQQIANGSTWIQHQGAAAVNLGTSVNVTGSDIQSVWHDSVGYAFPTPAPMTVTVQNRTGNWTDIDTCSSCKTSSNTVTKSVFTAWLNHGTSATSASYAYAVVPEIGQSNFASWTAKAPYSVEQNAATVQAIMAQNGNWHGAIFHSAGSLTFSDKTYLASDVPSAVILRATTDSLYLSVADPAHKSKIANLTLSVDLVGNGAVWNAKTGQSTIAVSLPFSGQNTGKTVVLGFKKATAATSSSSVASSSSVLASSSSSVVATSSSSKASSSSVAISSSSSSPATTSLLNTPTQRMDIAPVMVFDLMGHRVGAGNNALQALPQGTWIVVHTTSAGQQSELKRIP